MHVLTKVRDIPEDLKGAVIALGNFDGVHRGHQEVLHHSRSIAGRTNATAGALTFAPHPRVFFNPDKPLFCLTPLERKLALLAAAQLDFVHVLTFNAELAGMSAEEFAHQIIVRAWQASHVIIGYNFFFGKDRGGSPQILQQLGDKYGFDVSVIGPASDDGEIFSSSLVRELLRAGNVREAARILGHWWTVSAVVEPGAGRGAGMGYPTINIMLEPGQDLYHGIYAARVWVNGQRFDGAAYNGRRPTFDNGIAKLEIFLFDFNDMLYGHKIDVELIDFIRSDRAFNSPDDLVAQMGKDCARARDILAEVNSADPMLRFPIAQAISKSITTARD